MKNFHCCATCRHFQIDKTPQGTRYFCKRLGYDTSPKYQFACWHPKEHIQKLCEKAGTNGNS